MKPANFITAHCFKRGGKSYLKIFSSKRVLPGQRSLKPNLTSNGTSGELTSNTPLVFVESLEREN